MKKVNVNGKIFYTTSILPHSNGTYPVFNKSGIWQSFQKIINVKFID